MTTEQKNSYLEAHMEVQQHMHHVSMQLNKQAQNHSTSSHNQSMVGNQSISGSHQSGSSGTVSNPYLGTNPIKVNPDYLQIFFGSIKFNYLLIIIFVIILI